MSRDDEDPFGAAPPRKKPAYVIGQNIDALSVEDFADCIALLEAEIERLKAARAAKQASLSAASAFFKS